MSDPTKNGLKCGATGGAGFVALSFAFGDNPLAAAVGVVCGLVLVACLLTAFEWLGR